jgi:hypothetical protein
MPAPTATTAPDTREALLSWADRDGRFSLDDLGAILYGHGQTLDSWIQDCDDTGEADVYNAEALLIWLGH